MKLKQLVVAAAAAVASMSAHAVINTGEMFLNIVDDNGIVFTQDSGLTFSTLRSDAAAASDPSIPLAVVNLDPATIAFLADRQASGVQVRYSFYGMAPKAGTQRSLMASTTDVDDGSAANGFENAGISGLTNRTPTTVANNINNVRQIINVLPAPATHSTTANGTSEIDTIANPTSSVLATNNLGWNPMFDTLSRISEKSELWFLDTTSTNLNGAAFIDQLKNSWGLEYNGFFRFDANGGPTQFVIKAVPEPSTYALMALGLLGVGAIARRRGAVAK